MAKKKWSGSVTATSDAMDVASGTFKQRSAKKIAEDVERDAERSTRKKSNGYRSAMSMLTFYINRAGTNLSASQRNVLENAKDVLRAEFGPGGSKTTAKAAKPAKKSVARKKSTGKKAPAKKAPAKKTPAKKTPAKKTAARKR